MKLFNKQRIITRCLRGMLAVIILSAMLGLAACGADTGSPENEAMAGTEKDGIQDNSHALGSSGIQEGSVNTADAFDTGVFNEYEKANLKLAVEMEK